MKYAFFKFGISLLTVFCAAFVLTSCGDDSAGDLPVDMPAEEISEENFDMKPLEGNAYRVGTLQIYPQIASTEPEGASLTMTPSLADNSSGGKKLSLNFALAGFNLGEKSTDSLASMIHNEKNGQHITLILNNSADTVIAGNSFSMDFEQGEYQVLAVLARSTRESLKSKAAYALYDFSVGGTPTATDAKSKMLYLVSPHGVVEEGEKGVLVDFLLFNTELSEEGYQVNIHIDEKELFVYKHQPLLIKGLTKGVHTIAAQILDKYGKPIENAKYALSERTFEVK